MAYYSYKDTNLYYEEIGDGIPFLLIHGWAIDHSFIEKCMEPIFAQIDRAYRRIYVDLPGMGASTPGFVKNGDGMIEVLSAFMDSIAPGERFYLAGNSFGTVVCRALAAKCTDKVLGMLLIAPAFDHKIEGASKGIYAIDREFIDTLAEDERRTFMQMNANLTKETWERYREYVLPSIRTNEDNDYMRSKLKGSFSFDINKMLIKNHFNQPVLLLTAKYDLAVGYKEQYKWLDIFQKASYFVIDGAGHNMHIDQPVIFDRIVRGYIEQYFTEK